MKRMLVMFTLAATVCMAATPAQAQNGTVQLSWTQCDPVVQDLAFTGPGQVARMVLSVLGTADPHRGFRFQVRIGGAGPSVPDAWRFDAAGCNVGQVTLNTGALNKACPAFQGVNPLPIFNYGFGEDIPGTSRFDVLNAYDSMLTPDPATRYTVLQGVFDHAFSDTGPQDPLIACGNADEPVCFWLQYTEFLNPDLTSEEFDIGNNILTWNGQTTPICPTVQNENTTWGRVKGLYR